MKSNFDFLSPEFVELREAAQRAEQYARTDARASAIYARMALEAAVIWLYEHDNRLSLPYDTKLGSLLHAVDFHEVVPEQFFHKAKAIQKAGNSAVHNARRPVKQWESQHLTRELFHALFWLARTYHQRPLVEVGDFDTDLIPREEHAAAPVLDDSKIKELEAQLERQAKDLKNKEAELDERLEEMQAQVAAARESNVQKLDTHDYSEADTRKFLIDLELERAGWELDRKRDQEYEVTGMPNASGIGYVDYVLWGEDEKPLAVVEAKRTTEKVEKGQQQAKLYADCLEKMHGVRPLIYYTNGYEIHLWDDLDYPPRIVSGYRTREELELIVQRRSTRKSPQAVNIDESIVDRYYQKRAIGSLTDGFVSKHRKGLLVMATGTGKTRTAIALVDLLQRCNWVKRALFLADRVSLVNQAANAFKKNLPDSSPVNLGTEKTKDGRVYVATYPTMLGLIDDMEKGVARFGPGFFDLIVIDEAHRSVYQRYGAIFEYFDSLLVGLTATPREDIDRNTYDLFDLESGVPSDAYELEQAVRDEFLVPPKATQVNLRFPREGMEYDKLTDEEKQKWEETDWGDEDLPDSYPDGVNAAAINKWLFNANTVDKALAYLVENGHKVEGGDRLAKTIIFARNHKHAVFIEERFNHHYPHLKGSFARVIDNQVKYAQSVIDAFSIKNSEPHIAISVDMLDTGIDIPEVANLVFFKPVYSRIKFWQMIGRGTRLCLDLFGDGEDKQDFRVFDFCYNFDFFNVNPDGVEARSTQSLATRLFNSRVRLVNHIDELAENEGLDAVRQTLANGLREEVAAMPRENFLVRRNLASVERFADKESWESIDEEAMVDLQQHVAGLPVAQESEKVETKQFDLLCYRMELALLENNVTVFELARRKVVQIAESLEGNPSIPAIRERLVFIQEIQTSSFWTGITVAVVEDLRMKLRNLAQFVEKRTKRVVYTDFEDEIMEVQEIETIRVPLMTSPQYEKKVGEYLKTHLDSIAVQKLRMNEPLTSQDLESLEDTLVLIGADEGKELLQGLLERKEAPSLPYFVRTLVGLERSAAQALFSEYLSDRSLSGTQIRFIEMLVDQLAARGIVDASSLYESPFSDIHDEGPDGLFGSKGNVIEGVFDILDTLKKGIL